MKNSVLRRMKRLLSAMYQGCVINYQDGHRWIYCDDGACDREPLDDRVEEKWKEKGEDEVFRSKVYGSVDDALDRIDLYMQVLGEPSLEEQFDKWAVPMEPSAWGFSADELKELS